MLLWPPFQNIAVICLILLNDLSICFDGRHIMFNVAAPHRDANLYFLFPLQKFFFTNQRPALPFLVCVAHFLGLITS